jgi:replicative DNA helicase
MSLLSDYSMTVINGEDIITEDGQFYYGLILGLSKAGYQVADSMSIHTYLEDKKSIKDKFEERGGFSTVKDITDIINVNNLDGNYDELVKNNILIRLYENGFDVLKDLDKFKEMSSEQVYNYFEYKLADIATNKVSKIEVEDLTQGYDKYIKSWDEGESIGFKIGSKMLNYQLLGVHKKNLLLHLAGIGNGKTSSAISWYILPAIEQQDVVIIANEQSVSEWRQMILSTVLFNKIGGVKGFDRHKMMVGKYTDEQKEKLKEAAQWLKEQPGKIIFIETQDYSTANIKKIIGRYSALGCSLYILDTLKPMDDASDRSWGEFSEVAKELFIQAKKHDVAIIATAQLSPDAMSRRYLDLTCIAKAKAIAETATQVVMFRPLTAEEREKVKGFNYDGKIKKIVDLDKDKDYIMVFTPKNRFGQVTPQILMERNMNFNSYKDVAWTECSYDQFKTR